MKVLFFGDVVGKIGRQTILTALPSLKEEFRPDLLLLNGENSANGKGITTKLALEYKNAGIDCITSGNHIFDNREIIHNLSSIDYLIRPANYPLGIPGNTIFKTIINGNKVAVLNLLGQVFMPPIDSPFTCLSRLLETIQDYPVILVDIHAEATSEKRAIAEYCRGVVSAVIGTHTHVQTADAMIIAEHTGFVTDVGMVGARHSILGMGTEPILNRFVTSMPDKFEVPETDTECILNFVVLDIDDQTGQTLSIKTENRIIKNT